MLVPAAGCKKTEGPALPPATGQGAPPAPKIPQLKDLAPQAAEAKPTAERAGTGSLQSIDKAAKNGTIAKNTASRMKSRIAKRIAALAK